jgi:hypothetical protein
MDNLTGKTSPAASEPKHRRVSFAAICGDNLSAWLFARSIKG